MESRREHRAGWFGLGVIALFLAAAQFRHILLVIGPRFGDDIAAARGVVEGLPHWRLFQSRVLGPFLVDFASRLTELPYRQAYLLILFLLLLVFFGVLLAVTRNLWRSDLAAVGAAAAAWCLNAILMQGRWLYVWDHVDQIVFVLFVWAILSARPLWVVACILAVEIFNREVVILLSVWLALDAIARPEKVPGAPWKLTIEPRWRQFALGVALTAISLAVIETLRAALMVREVGLEIFSDANPPGTFVNLQWAHNWYVLKQSFVSPMQTLDIVFTTFLFAVIVTAVRGFFGAQPAAARLCGLHAVLWVATVILALTYETRVWLSFVPFMVLVFPLVWWKGGPAQAG